MDGFVTPDSLDPGDAVTVLPPASGLAGRPPVYELGLERLRSTFDLEPVEFPTATDGADDLYGHPERRVADVEDAFADPEVGGVVATIGGNDGGGSWYCRLYVRCVIADSTKHLDGDVLPDNPHAVFRQ